MTPPSPWAVPPNCEPNLPFIVLAPSLSCFCCWIKTSAWYTWLQKPCTGQYDSQRMLGATTHGNLDCIIKYSCLIPFTPPCRTTRATFMLSVSARQASPQMFLFKVSYLLEGARLTCWLKSMVDKHLYFATAFCQVMHYTCKIIPPYHNRVIDAQTYLFILWPHTLKIHFPKAVRMTVLKNPNPMVIAYVSPSVSLATCFK